MAHLIKFPEYVRLFSSLVLVAIIVLSSWMGIMDGGYFVGEWALITLILAGLALFVSFAGAFNSTGFSWNTVALGLFTAYAAWTVASLLWSPNRGDAWLGAGQTLLYLLPFSLTVGLISLGASRTWVLASSAICPAIVAVLTLLTLAPHPQDLFNDGRLIGTVGYANGEAAFLLVPFWIAVYLAGCRNVQPILRGLVLAGATLCVELAVLTQSRGAMVAMAVSLLIFFLTSGQRLRGLFALVPIVAALSVAFTSLNEVYLASVNQESVPAAIDSVLPTVWLTAAGAGLYGILWSLIDQRWHPPRSVTRAAWGILLASSIIVLVFGTATISERASNPVAWTGQKWEAFKTDKVRNSAQEQNRYLTASGSGRYTLWRVAWEDFASHPLLGVGTQNYEATFYQLREEGSGSIRQPHSLPLEVLSERGLVGFVLFFGFLATCLGAGLRERFRHLGSEDKAQVGAMSAAITYWFVHSCSEWFWQLPAITLPAMVYLALLVVPWQQLQVPPARWPTRVVGAGAALLVIAAVAPLYAADRYLSQSYTITNLSEALSAVEHAQRFDPLSPGLLQREAKLAMLAGDWSRAEKAYTETTRLNPEHYAPYVLLARYYERAGKSEEALSFYRKASTLNPLDEQLGREAAGQNEPGTAPRPPYLRSNRCYLPTQPGVYQLCSPAIRESI
jgi:O-antigen ligase